MKKTKLTRLIAVFLSLMMLGSTFGVGSYAADASSDDGSSTVSYDIADVQDLLNAESYTDYAARTADVPKGRSEVKIDAVDYNKDETDAKVEVVSNYNGALNRHFMRYAFVCMTFDVFSRIPSSTCSICSAFKREYLSCT